MNTVETHLAGNVRNRWRR